MTPQQILDQAREEFEKLIDNYFIHRLAMHEGGAYMHTVVDKSELNDWHTSTLQAFIEAEIERLEGMNIPLEFSETSFGAGAKTGYSQALSDQISHLKGLVTVKI